MIRIRPGRSWRMNPEYVGELRALDKRSARGSAFSEILDVLTLEVDGVDVTAGVGEARVLVAVDELAQAVLRLGEGEPAAQATVGPGPTELVLEARGSDVALTLLSLEPPARVLAGALTVDAQKLRSATLHAARELLLDLLALNPAAGDAPLALRLGESCAALAQRPRRPPRRWPARAAQKKTLVFSFERRRATESLRMDLPAETVARLRDPGGVKCAPFAPHLGHGSLLLSRRGGPGLACEGLLFFLVRNLLAEAEQLVEAWEGGARSCFLKFGPHTLQCDLATGHVSVPGWPRPAELPAPRLARLVALAALGYAKEARADDELAQDLRARARQLQRHCEDLETGDLRRAPETVAAPAAPLETQPPRDPLSTGRVRRLVYREAWRTPAPHALRVLPFPQGPLVIELPGELDARAAETGERIWRADAAPGAVARGPDLFYAEPGDALVRIEAATGEVRWKRRLRGAESPARLWAIPGGVLRALPGEGLCHVSDEGTLTFRARLPGGAPAQLAAVDRVLVAALGSGSLAGLDPSDARVLWKRRLKTSALLPHGARALVLSRDGLASIDPHTGEPHWERDVPEDSSALAVSEGRAVLLGGGELLVFSLADGAQKPAQHLPWACFLTASEDPEVLLATGPDGALARLTGRRWEAPPDEEAEPEPAQLQRGVVLSRGASTQLYDLADGVPVAQLPPARDAVLLPDLSCALIDDAGVSLHRLATHLSLIQDRAALDRPTTSPARDPGTRGR